MHSQPRSGDIPLATGFKPVVYILAQWRAPEARKTFAHTAVSKQRMLDHETSFAATRLLWLL